MGHEYAVLVELGEDEYEMGAGDTDDDDDAAIALVPCHEPLQVPSLQRVEDNDDGQDYYLTDDIR